jgi:hypothetical protein
MAPISSRSLTARGWTMGESRSNDLGTWLAGKLRFRSHHNLGQCRKHDVVSYLNLLLNIIKFIIIFFIKSLKHTFWSRVKSATVRLMTVHLTTMSWWPDSFTHLHVNMLTQGQWTQSGQQGNAQPNATTSNAAVYRITETTKWQKVVKGAAYDYFKKLSMRRL